MVGGSPSPYGDGLSFISDFILRQGDFKGPPSAYNFPDLSARIRGVRTSTGDLSTFIYAQQIKDLRARIYLVDHIPDLPARIFGLFQKDLAATIAGFLAQADLAARLQGTVFSDLLARITGHDAPTLRAIIGTHSPANLGAIIWAPEDLAAIIRGFMALDLPASITGLTFKNLPGRVLGIAAPSFRAVIRAIQSATDDLPSRLGPTLTSPDLTASIFGDFVGISATIQAIWQPVNLPAFLVPTFTSNSNLSARLLGTTNLDLGATIAFFSAANLRASLSGFGLGVINRDLAGIIQSVRMSDLSAFINAVRGAKDLMATIEARRDRADLGAFIRVDEIFITTILNIITLGSKDLRATIGNPVCDGGSASINLRALAVVQHANNLAATIQSFLASNLGASINSPKIFCAFDTIDVFFTRRHTRPKRFRATDTLTISYSPFRGRTLGASIIATPPTRDLGASIAAAFPLLKVSPFVSRITAVDLASNPLDITEIRLQMEGQLTEYIYVNGTDQSFIADANQQWRINIRSFEPIAANLFGDFAAARVCRLGRLTSFSNLDEAIRFCIAAVLGLSQQGNLGAYINSVGGYVGLPATISISDTFFDLGAFAGRVFPSDPLYGSINPTGQLNDLQGMILGTRSDNYSLPAYINQVSPSDLSATIIGV